MTVSRQGTRTPRPCTLNPKPPIPEALPPAVYARTLNPPPQPVTNETGGGGHARTVSGAPASAVRRHVEDHLDETPPCNTFTGPYHFWGPWACVLIESLSPFSPRP